eukprot:1003133-Prymnesium_polylepis.1
MRLRDQRNLCRTESACAAAGHGGAAQPDSRAARKRRVRSVKTAYHSYMQALASRRKTQRSFCATAGAWAL